MKETLKYFDYTFFLKFFIILAFLHYFHIFYRGLVTPEGMTYSSFLENNLNYLEWLTTSIIYSANLLVHFFGVNSMIEGNSIYVENSAIVDVWLPCLGLGISSLWVAFVITHDLKYIKKFLWSLLGVFIIWVINCWRIALLLLAMTKDWEQSEYLDHHDLFNIIAYAAIGCLIYIFYKKNRASIENNNIETNQQDASQATS